ncbi:MAG: PAS domain S-box protein [Desulfuromonadaceae bacterium]|nr:PAS domain S-box protein [Desulfuromonadaceae bacterium]MDD2855314.1 PAS domain S-box protein [Desulfuromonadaceae bacterium]
MHFNNFKSSFNIRIIILIMVVFVSSIWALTHYGRYILNEDTQRLLAEQQLLTVTMVAANIDAKLQTRLLTLERIAQTISPPLLVNAAEMQEFLEKRPHLQIMFNAGVFITDSNGNVIADIPVSANRIGLNIINSDYMIAALKEGKSSIGQQELGKNLKIPVFCLAAPICNAQGRVIGVIVGVTNLDKSNFLDDFLENSLGKIGGYLLVAPAQRQIITATDKKRIMESLPPTGADPFIDRALQGFKGSAISTTAQGLKALTAATVVPAAGCYVVGFIPIKEAFAPIDSMQSHLMLAASLITLLAFFMTFWLLKIQRVKDTLTVQLVERAEELQRKNHFEQFRNRILGLITEGESLSTVLEAIVLGVEEDNPEILCSILLLDSEGRFFAKAISPSLPDFYSSAIEGLEIGMGVGPCGTAAFTGQRVIVDDITTHQYCLQFQGLAARAGLGSCWSQPIISSSRQVLGAFGIYHREACEPTESEIASIEQIATLASIAIDKFTTSKALQESDELLTQFMLHSPIHAYVQSVTPTESRTIKCSDSFQDMLGMESEEMIGKTMDELFPADLAAKINSDNWAVITGGKAVVLDEELNDRYYTTFKFPIIQGDRTLLAGYTIEITERVQAEEMMQRFNEELQQKVSEQTRSLKESLYRIDQLSEQSHTMIWEVDAQGLYTYVNLMSERVFGYRPEEMVGKMHWYDVFPESERESIKNLIAPVFESRVQILNIENQTTTKDGRNIWWLTNGIPILNEDGSLKGLSWQRY